MLLLLLAVVSATLVAARPLSAAGAATPTPTPASPSTATADNTPFNPTTPGPCGSSSITTTTLTLDPSVSGCKGAGCKLTVTLTAGGASTTAATAARCTRPLPLVLVLPGFSARAYMYSPYTNLLASWGYAAVSYEAPVIASFPPLKDAYEGSPAFVALTAEAAQKAAASLNVTLDPRSLKTPLAIGHSRGGKIAALGLASGALFSAALLDPVDGGFGALFPPNPSAVAALRASPPTAGALLVQAGVQGLCNGAIVGGDSLFWGALVEGGGVDGPSWRTVLPRAGHGSLAALGGLFQPIAGLICGGKEKFGGLSESKAIDLAKTVAMEWIEKAWEGGSTEIPAEAAFCGFVAREGADLTPVAGADGRAVCPAVAKAMRRR
jgi:hypothetical protein